MEPPEEEECPASPSLLSSEEVLSSSGDPEEGSLSAPENSTFSEEEVSLAAEAFKAFSASDYSSALSVLESLVSLRGSAHGSPPVLANLWLAEHLAQKKALGEVLSSLEALLQGGDLEHESTCTLLYNLALGKFLQRQLSGAESLLLKLMNRCSHDPVALRRARTLLCRVYVAGKQGEKLAASLGDLGESHHFLKVTSLLLSKNHKALKKDLKDNGGGSEEKSSSALLLEFLRGNSEVLKGNPRKAHKLLSNLEGETLNAETETFLQNNLGVVHLLQDKPNLGAHYFTDALALSKKLLPQQSLLRNKKMEITYNLALGLLHAGTFTEASFEYFLQTTPLYGKRPGLWMHLAECCIQSHQQHNAIPTYADALASAKDSKHRRSTTLSSIGPIQHQKIVLNDSSGRPFTHPGVSKPVPLEQPKNKNLNLDFGLSCLRNAYSFLHSQESSSPSSSLLCSILLNTSYVSLLLQDYVTALAKANELLDLLLCSSAASVKDSSVLRLLGHLYAGEALIYLDRISEATAHLGPNKLQTLEEEPEASLGTSALNFNLSVAFALRGELDKAQGLLERRSGSPKSLELSTKFTMMNLYIHIMKKDMKTCREIIMDSCNVVKLPPPSLTSVTTSGPPAAATAK